MRKRQVIQVLVVDDFDVFADSLTRILNKEGDIEVVGEAANCAQALELSEQLQPDVVVLDHNLPDGTGIEVAVKLRVLSPKTHILMLSGRTDDQTVAEAIDAGCGGYVTKDRAVWELVSAVRLVHSGETYLSPDVLAAMMLRIDRSRGALALVLNEQEHDILRLMATGTSDKLIAKQLSLSLHGVRRDIRNALVKLGPVQSTS